MPGLEEIECYLRGLWLLIRGKDEGFQWLDFSERGFWRSWWAAVLCLPPTLLGWFAFRAAYLAMAPAGAQLGPGLIPKLAIIEATGWILPPLGLAVVALTLGMRQAIVPMIIAVNWLSVPLQWVYSLQYAIILLAPGSTDIIVSLYLTFLIASVGLHYLILRRILGGDNLAPFVLVAALFTVAFFVQDYLVGLFGLTIGSV